MDNKASNRFDAFTIEEIQLLALGLTTIDAQKRDDIKGLGDTVNLLTELSKSFHQKLGAEFAGLAAQ